MARFVRYWAAPCLLMVAILFGKPVHAQTNQYDTEGEAFLACQSKADIVASVNFWPDYSGNPHAVCSRPSNGARYFQCWTYMETPGGDFWTDCGNSYSYSNDTSPGGIVQVAQFAFPIGEECEFQDSSDQILVTPSNEPPPACVGGCEYEATTGTCDGGTCYFNMDPNGDTCDEPPPPDDDLPDNCVRNESTGAVACDCTADPTQAWCQYPPEDNDPNDVPPNCVYNESTGILACAETPPNDPPPDPPPNPDTDGDDDDPDDQDPPTNPGAPPGDDDPDTPDNPGDGDGDIDDDGDRDIDCNPLSNSDCRFTGSGTGRANCDTQPSCNGDPVGCAILYQTWAAMCYDPGEFTNPGDCSADLQCEGDVLLCEIIRQERTQFCLTYLGDGTVDTNVFDDEDFGQSLIDESEEVELPEGFDTAGFASGSCPIGWTANTSFGSFNISPTAFCDLASVMRPFVILSASILGVFIVVRAGKP